MEAGGAQGAALRMAQELEKRGYESEVIFLYKKRDVHCNGLSVTTLMSHKPNSILEYLMIIRRLYLYLRKNRAAAIITYTHYSNILGAICGKLAGVKKTIISQRAPVHSYPRVVKAIDYVIGVFPVYLKNVVVSKVVYDSFKRYPKRYKEKIIIVHNGITTGNVTDYKFEKKTYELNKRKKLLNVGRLSESKNQRFLVEMMKNLEECVLIIAGEGEKRQDLERYIKKEKLENEVILAGELPAEELNGLYQNVDIFVFPSLFEGFGFATIEAMSYGLPVIVSDIPVHHEIVENAGCILPLNKNTWINKIQLIFKDNKIKKQMGEKSIIQSKKFSLDKMVDGYLDALELA